MTFDKFLKRNQLIADHLAQIAAHRDSIGWVDSATPLDADFRDVLAAQERLVTAAERLLDSCNAAADISKFSSPDQHATFEPSAAISGNASLAIPHSSRAAASLITTH